MVEARRVGQAHAGFHQRFGALALVAAFQVGQLQRAVDAQHLGLAGRGRGHHRHAFGHRHRDDVGQVVLALCVVVLQRHHPARERAVGAAIMPV